MITNCTEQFLPHMVDCPGGNEMLQTTTVAVAS